MRRIATWLIAVVASVALPLQASAISVGIDEIIVQGGGDSSVLGGQVAALNRSRPPDG